MNYGIFVKYILGCAFIFCYTNLFCEKDITSKEHILEINLQKKLFNPFQASTPLLYPLKTSENFWLSDVLVGMKIEQWMKRVKMFL